MKLWARHSDLVLKTPREYVFCMKLCQSRPRGVEQQRGPEALTLGTQAGAKNSRSLVAVGNKVKTSLSQLPRWLLAFFLPSPLRG